MTQIENNCVKRESNQIEKNVIQISSEPMSQIKAGKLSRMQSKTLGQI